MLEKSEKLQNGVANQAIKAILVHLIFIYIDMLIYILHCILLHSSVLMAMYAYGHSKLTLECYQIPKKTKQ